MFWLIAVTDKLVLEDIKIALIMSATLLIENAGNSDSHAKKAAGADGKGVKKAADRQARKKTDV